MGGGNLDRQHLCGATLPLYLRVERAGGDLGRNVVWIFLQKRDPGRFQNHRLRFAGSSPRPATLLFWPADFICLAAHLVSLVETKSPVGIPQTCPPTIFLRPKNLGLVVKPDKQTRADATDYLRAKTMI